jgi:thiamine transport system substrate-binding protein
MNGALTTLVVYAYTSFTSSWGPGPTLVKEFEKTCRCQVELVSAGDGGALVGRLKLEGEKSGADVVLGLDETLLPKVKKELNWEVPFVAFDTGPYAFVYDSEKIKDPPHSLDDLLEPRWKGQILLEDPRLSTTGLGFLLWVIKEKGDGAWAYFTKLKPQVKTISPSWDLAYGLFKNGQGDLVFSYWTSPAYHIQEERSDKYKAAVFRSGHYSQTEYMAVVPTSKNKALGEKFMAFILTPEAQAEIPRKNFMYPVNKKAPLTEAFKKLGRAKLLTNLNEKERKDLESWLKKWREIFS